VGRWHPGDGVTKVTLRGATGPDPAMPVNAGPNGPTCRADRQLDRPDAALSIGTRCVADLARLAARLRWREKERLHDRNRAGVRALHIGR